MKKSFFLGMAYRCVIVRCRFCFSLGLVLWWTRVRVCWHGFAPRVSACSDSVSVAHDGCWFVHVSICVTRLPCSAAYINRPGFCW
uniref:Uncharacterized protein n=1 Tax=Rhipicephalus zambeziensis TaxID=60191 RepID=A0A224YFU0_9ACAR